MRETFNYAMGGPEELLDWSATTTSGTYKSQNLAYDGAGRVTTEVHQTPTSTMSRSYTFDDLGRVTRLSQPGGVGAGTEDYTHDPLGNVLTRTATTGMSSMTYTFDPVDPDRLCKAVSPNGLPPQGCQFSYDGAGNITEDRSNASSRGLYYRYFAYDAANRIVSARRSSTTVSFTYGPAGRAKTVTNGSFPRTVWHFGGLIEDVRPTGTTTVRTTFTVPGPLGIAASLRFDSGGGSATVYSHGDARGSRFFTDSLGRVMQESVYSLFGRLLGAAPDYTALSYTDDLWNGGDYYPEVGISILGERAYDAETGRFLERDPIINAARAVTANPYAFAFNDPANLTDPSGMQPPFEDKSIFESVQPDGCLICTDDGGGVGGAGLVDNLPGSKGVIVASGAPVGGNMNLRSQQSVGGALLNYYRKNNWVDPRNGLRRGRAFLEEGDRTLRHALKLNLDCRGNQACVAGTALWETGSAVRDVFDGSAHVDPMSIITGFCPGGDCTATEGKLGFMMVTGGDAEVVNAADDMLAHVEEAFESWGAAHYVEPLDWILPGSLPAAEEANLQATLSHIDAGTVPTGPTSQKWGTRFKNNAGDLPGGRLGVLSPYREYRVAPVPGMSGAGTLRVVVNRLSGEMYYTWNHYGQHGAKPAFVRIR